MITTQSGIFAMESYVGQRTGTKIHKYARTALLRLMVGLYHFGSPFRENAVDPTMRILRRLTVQAKHRSRFRRPLDLVHQLLEALVIPCRKESKSWWGTFCTVGLNMCLCPQAEPFSNLCVIGVRPLLGSVPKG